MSIQAPPRPPVAPAPPPAPAPQAPAPARSAARGGRPRAERPLLPGAAARLAAFAALGLFGAVHWVQMIEPAPNGRAVGLLLVALAAAGAVEAAARRSARAAAGVAAAGAVLGVAGVALTAGVPARLLLPAGLGELADGVVQGLEVLPDLRVPYAGSDPWVAIVILAGGGLILLVAGLLSPARRAGARLTSAALLALLYGVPAVQFQSQAQIGRGIAFTILLAAFLWLERVPRRAAPMAAALVAAAAAAGALAAPALDRDGPWVDYESLAGSLAPGPGTTFDFEHGYGPIDWPRDGRQLLRIRARDPLYWKAENLEAFDGLRWRRAGPTGRLPDPAAEVPAGAERFPRWRERLRVTLRGLESETLIGAGTTLAVVKPPQGSEGRQDPVGFSLRSPLERGDAYEVEVYAPRPTPRQLEAAGTDYGPEVASALKLQVPRGPDSPNAAGDRRPPLYYQVIEVEFRPFGSPGPPDTLETGFRLPASGVMSGSPYARTWALASRLRAASATPYDYVRRVEAYLGRGFSYSEDPPERPVPLESFLFDDQRGYCQQFSGAMAVLLRMGGVPARVVGGFSPGSLSAKRREWVVRDTDAHSWVEAWFPGYGWVTFDPTPAASPARLQISLGAGREAGAGGARLGSGDRPESRRVPTPAPAAGGQDAGGTPWLLVAGAVIAAVLAGAAALLVRRRRRPATGDPWFADLTRALQRAGRAPAAPTTLRALEREFRSPGAVAYLRAVRARRYGGTGPAPSAAERQALRAELGGSGLAGRLRGLWAVPPGTPSQE